MPSRPRRRGRTARLVGAAALLGLVAGTCAGYLVQAGREPTKLPSLSQPVLRQARGEVEPLTAARDPRLSTDGDLRKLLLKRPSGAREAGWVPRDGWMGLAAYAGEYTQPADKFGDLVTDRFRRAAVTGWKDGSAYGVDIRLVQYRQEDSMAAADAYSTPSYGIRGSGDAVHGKHVPGAATVSQTSRTTYVEPKPYGAEQVRQAFVAAGDVYAVILQSREGGALTVPFQQTVTLQTQLLA
ncbi:hypothetical protein AQJ66_07695 [Streptomyces bungoensis]|uniref:Uncharacterized protein n=1 Tax=Streptomyces bungoensis TaxID=285568 RepID=A0A117RFP8_9ACTN|nr:hypothetical protein [Streptomyces bungoensis]KUN88231.1 hypothetical protein AQJ66_07695 [Streptomyces bungoensis]